jgi:hypothetical protein
MLDMRNSGLHTRSYWGKLCLSSISILKSLKKDTDRDVVVKELEGIKTALEGL